MPLDQFVVQLLSGSTVLASGSLTEADIASGQFQNLSFTYQSTDALSGPLTIRFQALGVSSDYRQVNFDNVKLDVVPVQVSAVPEPGTWAMMIVGTGLAGATLRRRRGAQFA